MADCLAITGATATGKVMRRLVLSFHNGKLMRVDRGEQSYVQGADGWQKHAGSAKAHLAGGEGATIVESHLGTGATNVGCACPVWCQSLRRRLPSLPSYNGTVAIMQAIFGGPRPLSANSTAPKMPW